MDAWGVLTALRHLRSVIVYARAVSKEMFRYCLGGDFGDVVALLMDTGECF